MMRIGIQADVLDHEINGPKTYIEELCRSLLREFNDEFEYVLFHSDASSDHPLFNEAEELVVPRNFLKRERVLNDTDLDLIHYHGFKTLEMLGRPMVEKPCIATIHGLAEIALPGSTTRKHHFISSYLWPLLVDAFDHLITVTDTSKREICDLLDVPDVNITRSYYGLNNRFKRGNHSEQVDGLLPANIVNSGFILNVNSIDEKTQYRKNVDNLFSAYAEYHSNGGDKPLVLVGPGWESDRIDSMLEENSVTDHVYRTGAVPHKDLPPIYEAATMYVFPSRYEGFGMSALEAMAMGTPTIISNEPSVVEITGGHAEVYGHPENASGLARKMLEVEQDEELAELCSRKGPAWAERFEWEKCARETVSVYDTLAQ